MPLGSLREQLTFPDSYAGAAAGNGSPVPGESLGEGGGTAPRRHSGSGGGDSDSGEEDEGAPSGAAVGSGRRIPVVRSGPAAAGYRRVASSKGVAVSGGAPGAPEAVDHGRPGPSPAASAALDAELRELLATVCLPNLLPR